MTHSYNLQQRDMREELDSPPKVNINSAGEEQTTSLRAKGHNSFYWRQNVDDVSLLAPINPCDAQKQQQLLQKPTRTMSCWLSDRC